MRHAIFDFDGTLFDSMPIWGGAWMRLIDRYQVTPPDGVVAAITPLGIRRSAEYLAEHLPIPDPPEKLYERVCAMMIPAYEHTVEPKEGAIAYLEKLKSEGVHLHILSASIHAFTFPCLKRYGIFDWFEHIWDCGELGYMKSDPAIYDHIASLLGCDKRDMVMFDDNAIAVATARKAGVEVVGVYDAAWENEQDAVRSAADRYIKGFKELL